MKIDEKIPFGIAEYINKNFKEDFLFEGKRHSEKK
jgi:hypothetical protein